MNEMKPEDVMRALECCQSVTPIDCRKCPYKDQTTPEYKSCCNLLVADTLALLREKGEEIERLEKHLDYKCIYGYDGDVMEYCVQGPCPHYKTESEIRAKAITDFAERLKYTLCINNEENTEFFDYAYTLETIDQIAKELGES